MISLFTVRSVSVSSCRRCTARVCGELRRCCVQLRCNAANSRGQAHGSPGCEGRMKQPSPGLGRMKQLTTLSVRSDSDAPDGVWTSRFCTGRMGVAWELFRLSASCRPRHRSDSFHRSTRPLSISRPPTHLHTVCAANPRYCRPHIRQHAGRACMLECAL